MRLDFFFYCSGIVRRNGPYTWRDFFSSDVINRPRRLKDYTTVTESLLWLYICYSPITIKEWNWNICMINFRVKVIGFLLFIGDCHFSFCFFLFLFFFLFHPKKSKKKKKLWLFLEKRIITLTPRSFTPFHSDHITLETHMPNNLICSLESVE